jgi:ABC-2 type transport system permease protein
VSFRGSLRATGTLWRVGLAEALAYRAEMFIWILATTMPLIMMALWTTVAREAPVGRFGEKEFAAYFLATFIVRQLASSWAAWQLSYEVREGTLSQRLLRPVHPVWHIAVENWSAMPLRLVVALPVAIIALAVLGAEQLPADRRIWPVWLAAMAGAWLLTFFSNVAIGSLAFYFGSSVKVMEVWLALYFVLSGYTVPIEVFPEGARKLVELLPFRFQIGFPVELMTGAYELGPALAKLGQQWAWVVVSFVVALWAWRRGLRRFEAYGG